MDDPHGARQYILPDGETILIAITFMDERRCIHDAGNHPLGSGRGQLAEGRAELVGPLGQGLHPERRREGTRGLERRDITSRRMRAPERLDCYCGSELKSRQSSIACR